MPELLSFSDKTLRLINGQLIRKIIMALKWWHIVLLFLLVTLYWYAAMNRTLSEREIQDIGAARLEAVKKEITGKHGPIQNPTDLNVPINPLVEGTIQLHINWNDKGEAFINSIEMVNERFRYENIILLWGLCLGTIIALAAARPSRASPPISQNTEAGPKETPSPKKDLTAAESTLSTDVATAATRAADIYRRATFLLAGGILMAFIGISVFAVINLPTEYSDSFFRTTLELRLRDQLSELQHGYIPAEVASEIEELRRLLGGTPTPSNPYPLIISRAIRPFGMLIFIEGIAWFLLRQYRSLIEDYKTFVRIHLKRSNYLIALQAASTAQKDTLLADLIRVMLNEDLTGRLSKDQTTESLEAFKNAEKSPLIEALIQLTGVLREIKPELFKNRESTGG
jgi:hypothetical protein